MRLVPRRGADSGLQAGAVEQRRQRPFVGDVEEGLRRRVLRSALLHGSQHARQVAGIVWLNVEHVTKRPETGVAHADESRPLLHCPGIIPGLKKVERRAERVAD